MEGNNKVSDTQVSEKYNPSALVKIAKQIVAPGAAFNLLINILFGSGPIYLPGEYLAAGWLLSTIFTALVAVVSWLCAEYVIESMSNINALVHLDKINEANSIQDDISGDFSGQADLIDTTQDEDQTLNDTEQNPFELRQVMEFGQMSKYLWGKCGDIATTIILTIYLIGVLISKTIASSNILANMFEYIGHIEVLDSYYFWLGLFCVSAIAFSFSDIGGVKILQVITVIIRFTVIGLMILGPLYMIIDGQGGGLQPINPNNNQKLTAFNFKGFEGFFSTAIFALLCHHSIPSILTNVEPKFRIRQISYVSFILGAVLFITISLTGIAAFQGQMVDKEVISIYTQNFQGHINWIYYIVSFYMFLNVAAFPVIIITCRNNIMKCFFPHKIPKQSWKMTPHTAAITVCLIVPIVLISIIAKEKAETVIGVVGGVFGVFLMILIPSAIVIFTRKELKKRNINYQKQNKHVCIFSNDILPFVFQGIGWICLGFNLYQDIAGWINPEEEN